MNPNCYGKNKVTNLFVFNFRVAFYKECFSVLEKYGEPQIFSEILGETIGNCFYKNEEVGVGMQFNAVKIEVSAFAVDVKENGNIIMDIQY